MSQNGSIAETNRCNLWFSSCCVALALFRVQANNHWSSCTNYQCKHELVCEGRKFNFWTCRNMFHLEFNNLRNHGVSLLQRLLVAVGSKVVKIFFIVPVFESNKSHFFQHAPARLLHSKTFALLFLKCVNRKRFPRIHL